MAKAKSIRCAVYTRKSSEEGLDQEFNSLDAQREACEAYVLSQAGEGWTTLKARYDDGGISGGTMERPGLKRLLSDIKTNKIDVVVVYKVDRLTRSLTDFAKIVEVFDANAVSFVSVTQAFNTTTSMGRLTLNMLLSFAQFEREVTGERIRDKIAASKKKGIWMGGFIPLGYDAKNRELVINEAEAETVRTIFDLYLEHGTVRAVKAAADRAELKTKCREAENGNISGGIAMSRGYIYKLLSNPVYVGRIAHKGEVYDGQHAAIIDQATWDQVQAKLHEGRQNRKHRPDAKEPALLAGLLFDEDHAPLTPSHAVKNGKRYRYYISQRLIAESGDTDEGVRLPAYELERRIIDGLTEWLTDESELLTALEPKVLTPDAVTKILKGARRLATALKSRSNRMAAIQEFVRSITLKSGSIEIRLENPGLREWLGTGAISADDAPVTVTLPGSYQRSRGGRKMLVGNGKSAPENLNPALIQAVARGHEWFDRIATGKASGVKDIARQEGFRKCAYVGRVIRLAFLAPDITEAILRGKQPPDLTADWLIRLSSLPMSWEEQRRLFVSRLSKSEHKDALFAQNIGNA